MWGRWRRSAARARRDAHEAALWGLAVELPDEDIVEDLDDQLDRYRMGSKPRCEEVEYLWLVEEATRRR